MVGVWLSHRRCQNWVRQAAALTERLKLLEATIEDQKARIGANVPGRLAQMKHDLKSPLTSVLGFCDLLKSTSLPAKQERFLNNIDQGAHQILAILEAPDENDPQQPQI
jgi:signal transduction histidine kinase